MLFGLYPGSPLCTLLIVTPVEKNLLVLPSKFGERSAHPGRACARGNAHLAFPVAEVSETTIRAERTLLVSIHFASSPMRRVRVRGPVLGESISFMAVRSFRKIVAVAIGMRVSDNNGAIRSRRRFTFRAKRLE
jgi:hypothetical protein